MSRFTLSVLRSFVPPLLCLLSILMICGCATDAKIKPMLNGMSHVNQAITAFGPPMHTSDMHGGAKVYIWNTSRNVQMGGYPVYEPDNRTHTGTIYSPSGGAYSYSGRSYGSGNVSYTPVYNVNYICTLQMIVEQDGGIRTWSYRGNTCDSLILNETVPSRYNSSHPYVDGAGTPSLATCLRDQSKAVARDNKDFDTVKKQVDNVCFQLIGKKDEPLSSYYVKKALEGM